MQEINLNTIGDDLTGLIDDIRRIDNNEDLKVVWDAMREQWARNTKSEVTKYKIGDNVVVTFKSGKLYPGIVTKVNTKTVGVELTGDYEGRKYNVSPRWLNLN